MPDAKPSFQEQLDCLETGVRRDVRQLEERLEGIVEDYQKIRRVFNPPAGLSPLLDDVVTTVTARDQMPEAADDDAQKEEADV